MITSRSIAVVVVLLLASSVMIGLTAGTDPSNQSNQSAPNSSVAIPDDGPDYGVNETTFPLLWSEGIDDGNLSIDDFEDENVSSREEFTTGLAQSTDIVFEEPPDDVEICPIST